jgi:hypothetical protein
MGVCAVSFPALVREVHNVCFVAHRAILRGAHRLDLRLQMTTLNRVAGRFEPPGSHTTCHAGPRQAVPVRLTASGVGVFLRP